MKAIGSVFGPTLLDVGSWPGNSRDLLGTVDIGGSWKVQRAFSSRRGRLLRWSSTAQGGSKRIVGLLHFPYSIYLRYGTQKRAHTHTIIRFHSFAPQILHGLLFWPSDQRYLLCSAANSVVFTMFAIDSLVVHRPATFLILCASRGIIFLSDDLRCFSAILEWVWMLVRLFGVVIREWFLFAMGAVIACIIGCAAGCMRVSTLSILVKLCDCFVVFGHVV